MGNNSYYSQIKGVIGKSDSANNDTLQDNDIWIECPSSIVVGQNFTIKWSVSSKDAEVSIYVDNGIKNRTYNKLNPTGKIQIKSFKEAAKRINVIFIARKQNSEIKKQFTIDVTNYVPQQESQQDNQTADFCDRLDNDVDWFGKFFNIILVIGVMGFSIYYGISQYGDSIKISLPTDKKVKMSDVKADESKDDITITYEGKPFTGTVETGDNGEIKVKDGKPLYLEKSYQNGYRMKEYPDRTKEYYDYNGNRITAKEFEEGIAR